MGQLRILGVQHQHDKRSKIELRSGLMKLSVYFHADVKVEKINHYDFAVKKSILYLHYFPKNYLVFHSWFLIKSRNRFIIREMEKSNASEEQLLSHNLKGIQKNFFVSNLLQL